MDTLKIKKTIGQCQNREDLNLIVDAALRRIRLLRENERKRDEDYALSTIKKAKEGNVLAITKDSATALSIPVAPVGRRQTKLARVAFVRGEIFPIVAIQRKAKRVWIGMPNGESACLELYTLIRVGGACFPDELHAQVALASGRA